MYMYVVFIKNVSTYGESWLPGIITKARGSHLLGGAKLSCIYVAGVGMCILCTLTVTCIIM